MFWIGPRTSSISGSLFLLFFLFSSVLTYTFNSLLILLPWHMTLPSFFLSQVSQSLALALLCPIPKSLHSCSLAVSFTLATLVFKNFFTLVYYDILTAYLAYSYHTYHAITIYILYKSYKCLSQSQVCFSQSVSVGISHSFIQSISVKQCHPVRLNS